MLSLKPVVFILGLLFGIYFSNAQSHNPIKFYEISGLKLAVYTPPDYNPERKYPVVYFNDGQWLFSYPESIELDTKLDSAISQNKIKEIIVVGIYSDQRTRTAMYVPYNDPYLSNASSPFSSKAKIYANKVIKRVIPFVDKKYGTIKTKEGRAILGFSFGGLNATWMGLKYPDYFGMSGGFSPSYWVNEHQIFKEAESYKTGSKIWFDVGTREWNYYVPLIDILKDNGGEYGTSIFYYEIPEGEHKIDDWKSRILYPLYVFAGTGPVTMENWSVEIEIIQSQSRSGVYYLRLNPIATFNNGLKYSLTGKVKYKLINESDGEVFADGRFRFINKQNLEVSVSLGNEKKTLLIDYMEVKNKMK